MHFGVKLRENEVEKGVLGPHGHQFWGGSRFWGVMEKIKGDP